MLYPQEQAIGQRFTTQQHYEMYLVVKEAVANIIKRLNCTFDISSQNTGTVLSGKLWYSF